MKSILVLIAIMLFAGSGIQAQKQSAQMRPNPETASVYSRYQLSTAPATLVWSTLNLGVERRMTDRTSLLALGEIGYRNLTLWESFGGKYLNYGGKLEYRHYLGTYKTERFGSLRGPYLSGWIRATRVGVQARLQQKDYTIVTSQSLTPGIAVGWKFPLSRKLSNITLDIALGGGYRMGNVAGRYAEKSRSILFKDRGFVPALGFRVGYSPAMKGGAASTKEKPVVGKETGLAIAYHDQYPRKKRKAIEKALAGRNFYPGKVDGRFDAETIQAIRQFQRKNGLATDGKAGSATLKKLKLE